MFKKTYKINSKEIELNDRYEIFDAENLEDALFELYRQNTGMYFYDLVVNEKLRQGQKFYESKDLIVYRTSEKINVVFETNGQEKYVSVNSGNGWQSPPSFIIKTKEKINNPFVKISFLFSQQSGSQIEVKLKKSGNTYYSLVFMANSPVKLYKTINGSTELVFNAVNTILPVNQKIDATIFFYKGKFMINVNEASINPDRDTSIKQDGEVEIELKFNYTNTTTKIGDFEIGKFLVEMSNVIM